MPSPYMSRDLDHGYSANNGLQTFPEMDAFALYNVPAGSVAGSPTWTTQSNGFVGTDTSPSLSYTSQDTRSLNSSQGSWTAIGPRAATFPMARNVSGMSTDLPLQSTPLGYMPGYPMPDKQGPRISHVMKPVVNRVSPPRTAMPMQTQVMSPRMSGSTYHRGQPMARGPMINPGYPVPGPQDNLPGSRHAQMMPGRMTSPCGPSPNDIRSLARTSPEQKFLMDPIEKFLGDYLVFPAEDQFGLPSSNVTFPGPPHSSPYTQPWPEASAQTTAVGLPDDLFFQSSMQFVPAQAPAPARRPSIVSSNDIDLEEGRYRTDPLYNRCAGPDGLYHCPFYHEGCHHNPTKLKCNYEYDLSASS